MTGRSNHYQRPGNGRTDKHSGLGKWLDSYHLKLPIRKERTKRFGPRRPN